MESLLSNSLYISIGFIILFLLTLAFTKVGVERQLLNDVHKLLAQISRAVFVSIIGSILFVFMLELFANDSVTDYELNEFFYFYLTGFLIFLGFYLGFSGLITSMSTRIYYIYFKVECLESKNSFEKLFIIKAIDNNTVLLCNKKYPSNDSIQMIVKKEFLLHKNIYTESKNFIETLKFNFKSGSKK